MTTPILTSLTGVIWSFAIPGGLTVLERESLGRDEYGQDRDPIETPILHDPIVVQPLSGAERMQVPEGDREKEWVLIHTCRPIHVSRGGTDRLSSVLEYDPLADGNVGRYVVKICEPWARQAGAWRCHAVREEES